MTKRNDMNVENVPHIVAACCILHNVYEIHGDTFNEAWIANVDDTLEQPAIVTVSKTSSRGNRGTVIRDTLVEYFSS